MLIVPSKLLIFNLKKVYFSQLPRDVNDCDVVIFIDCPTKIKFEGFSCRRTHTATIDLTQNLDTVWHHISQHFKKSIIRAKKEGIKLERNKGWQQFYQLYKSFKKEKRFGPILGIDIPKLEIIRKYGTLFTAEYDGKFLGGNLYLEDGNRIRLWLSGSRRLEVTSNLAQLISRANRLICWGAIEYAKEKGLKEFDFGGLWPDEEAKKDKIKENINHFKLSFGAKPITRYSYQKIYSKSYKLTQDFYYLIKKFI